MKSRTKKAKAARAARAPARTAEAARVGRPAHAADLSTDAGRFGARLRAARLAAGFSVAVAARRACVPAGTWYDWESGRYSEGIRRFVEILRAVLAALDCEIEDLLDEWD